ncbi:F0F1 ATP synthase subunit B [Marivita sp. GX14005]|uniref:F0F1 ATP synthase subunit B family protein n=1 Tax=Marivita sp. GX14005 TaxID=2942276 RepID=UPI002019BD30|nr:F0F1 ATP synthase subunit B [Marivita sp. GX14005]MCL3882935.1 F0F1 ATP synthase subunit B [Marivita sp. GX14005]
MSIDWITVGAQIANFLVLVWLLKRFLYRPILDGIDAREAEIAERMGEAGQIRAEAEAREAEYRAEIAALSASRADVLAAARLDAEAERAELLQKAREAARAEEAERLKERERAAQEMRAGLERDGAAAILALTRKALADLADETLERRIVERGAERLRTASGDLAGAAEGGAAITAISREALPPETREAVQAAVTDLVPDAALRFDVDPAMSPGLRLTLGATEIEWTVESYLSQLDATLDTLAEEMRDAS